MISLLAYWLAQHVGVRAAKPVAWALVIVVALLLLSIAKCTYDGRVVADHDAKVTAKTQRIDAAAKDEAAAQRATDTITINQAEKERNDAINDEPAGRPDAARNRLNCQRLRRAGFDTADFAECR